MLQMNGLTFVPAFTIIVLIKDEQQKLASNVRPTVDCTDFSATTDVTNNFCITFNIHHSPID